MTTRTRRATAYDVAVVGGGMIGVSIAYSLARRGASVLVLDGRGLGGGASGANFGLVLWSDAEPGLSTDLAHQGFARFPGLGGELDWDLEYRGAIGIGLATTDEERRIFERDCDRLKSAGFRAWIADLDELRQREPNLCVDAGVRAALCTEEGVLNPFQLVSGYWRQAERHGARLASGVTVLGFSVTGDTIQRLSTSAGDIAVGEVVLAAGAWTRALGQKLGIHLPEYYIQAEAIITESVPPLLRGFVHRGDLKRIAGEAWAGEQAVATGWETHDRVPFGAFDFGAVQTAAGNVLVGQMTHIHLRLSEEVSRRVFREAAAEARRFLPALGSAMVLRGWRSPVPFTPDHLPLLGRVAGWRNLTVASGFKSTIIVTPRVGELVAELLVDGRASLDLSPFDPLRFGPGVGREEATPQ